MWHLVGLKIDVLPLEAGGFTRPHPGPEQQLQVHEISGMCAHAWADSLDKLRRGHREDVIGHEGPAYPLFPGCAAVEADPRYPNARATLGHVLLASGRPAEALAQLDQAVALDPRHAPAAEREEAAHRMAALPAPALQGAAAGR